MARRCFSRCRKSYKSTFLALQTTCDSIVMRSHHATSPSNCCLRVDVASTSIFIDLLSMCKSNEDHATEGRKDSLVSDQMILKEAHQSWRIIRTWLLVNIRTEQQENSLY